MTRRFVGTAVAAILCLTTSMTFGEPRGKGGEKEKGPEPHNKAGEKKPGEKPAGESKSGNKPPGGAWSEEKPSSQKQNPGAKGEGKEAESKNKSQTSRAEGAAAERAAEKNKQPQATGAEGAAAGAAAANRNKPAASGAEGAAAANRNKPAASGAEGAAAGAALSNRNKPAASGAEGAAVGAAAANRNNPAVSGATGAALGTAAANQNQAANAGRFAAVRGSFDHPSLYNEQWHNDHPGAWTANNWASGTNVWKGATLTGVGAYCGYANSTPVSYGYGNNVTYQDGNVFVDGQNAGTGEVFSQQAADLAQIGQDAETTDSDQWLPLGVFALVRNEDQHAQLTLQLAISKNGIIRGNYTDVVTDHTLPIHGSVEKGTQRAAWTVNNNKNFFMEAGISNLTSGEAPTLIHKYNRTEKWLLVRLAEPGSSEPVAANR